MASRPWRNCYRNALGLREGQRLVVVTSTWGPQSLLGSRPELPARLLADLPADEYRVAAIVHPNVWHGHGPWQVRAWLADCRRAGLLLVPPREGWRGTLVAADCVVGDHGSVTLYGAMAGRPTLLAAFAEDEIDPVTTMAALGRRASRLHHQRPLRQQIQHAIAGGSTEHFAADLARDTVANPGAAAQILRDTMYGLMGLTQPRAAPRLTAVPPPAAEVLGWGEAASTPALLAACAIDESGSAGEPVRIRVERYPAEVDAVRTTQLPDPHLVVDDTEPDQRLRHLADVLVRRDEASGAPSAWLAGDVLDRHPACSCAAEVTPGGCVLRLRDGRTVELFVTRDGTGQVDPAVLASAVHGWLAAGRDVASLGADLTAETGHARIRASVTVHPAPA